MASVLMMSSSNIVDVLALMAGILYLGQLQFTTEGSALAIAHSRTDPLHHPAPHLDIDAVALMLGLSTSAVTIALTSRTIAVEGRLIEVPLCAGKAASARDAIAKEIYSRLFQWIVGAANARTRPPTGDCSTLSSLKKITIDHHSISVLKKKDHHSISVLDIFGFESFENNYFEQLCINYANEKLQAKFSADMIASVQAEYEQQGVPWSKVSFVDNSEVVALIEGRRGLIDLCNEACMLPTGSDALILSRLKTAYFDKHHPICLQSTMRKEPSFCIAHYAGRVSYNVAGFIDKNKDAILAQVSSLLATSSNSILAEIFAEKSILDDGSNRSRNSMHSPTIFTKFKSQLHSLMADIESTKTLYVRCIKPNSSKSSEEFNRAEVVDQLRSGGMTEAVRVGRSAYPQKMSIHDFLTHFSMMMMSGLVSLPILLGQRGEEQCRIDPRDHCIHLLREITADMLGEGGAGCTQIVGEGLGEEQPGYEVGFTVIYFADGVLEHLERKRAARIKVSSEILGSFISSSIIRKRYIRFKQKATMIQACVRRWGIAMQLVRWHRASNKIKNVFLRWKKDVQRQQQQQQQYHRLQLLAAAVTRVQRAVRRRTTARRRGIERKTAAAATKLQKWFRGILSTRNLQIELQRSITDRDQAVQSSSDLQIELHRSITDRDQALQSSSDLQIELQRSITDRDQAMQSSSDLQIELHRSITDRDQALQSSRDLQIELQRSITDRDQAMQSSRDLQIELHRSIVDCYTALRTLFHGWRSCYSIGSKCKWGGGADLGRGDEEVLLSHCAYEKIIITALLLIVLVVHG